MAKGDLPAFEPVLLDLSNSDDYYVITEALREFASKAEFEAEGEDERIRYNNLDESTSDAPRFRAHAARAIRLADSIERQLEANSDARRAAKGE